MKSGADSSDFARLDELRKLMINARAAFHGLEEDVRLMTPHASEAQLTPMVVHLQASIDTYVHAIGRYQAGARGHHRAHREGRPAAPHAGRRGREGDVVKRRAWLGPLIHCWLTYLVAPINGLGYPQVQGMGPDMRHPRRSLFR